MSDESTITNALQNYRSGYVAVVGRPNVGKSTLINRILEVKLSITTSRPQTTRHRIIGIHSGETFQIIFWDTPGLLQPSYLLQEKMMKAATDAIGDADILLMVVEASDRPFKHDLEVLKQLQETTKPILVVINKVDLLDRKKVLPMIDAYSREEQVKEIVPISALTGENVDDVERVLVKHLPLGPPFFPPDQLTEFPERFFVAEIIREKIFLHYSEEIPYSTAVVIDEFRERPEQKDYIKARIVVERESQKGIIIGKGGRALKKIGKIARDDIESFLERPVYLELWVVVREKWRKKEVFIKEFGYDPRRF